jgi:hypothetical protein
LIDGVAFTVSKFGVGVSTLPSQVPASQPKYVVFAPPRKLGVNGPVAVEMLLAKAAEATRVRTSAPSGARIEAFMRTISKW